MCIRDRAGVEGGQTVDITLELDMQPRTVDVPDDLAAALAALSLIHICARRP